MAQPKSDNFIVFFLRIKKKSFNTNESKMFSGFMSRWITPEVCSAVNAKATCLVASALSYSVSRYSGLFFIYLYNSPSTAYSSSMYLKKKQYNPFYSENYKFESSVKK